MNEILIKFKDEDYVRKSKYMKNHKRSNKINTSKIPSLVLVTAPSANLLHMLKDTLVVLDSFDIPYEVSILAAHRAPRNLFRVAEMLENNGIEVLIAGASGSAHLPGAIAAITNIPIIGVPLDSSHLRGVDSLYSMLQMPKGVPVGVMGIDSAFNAGIFACQILSIKHPYLKSKLRSYKQKLAEEVDIEDKNVKSK